MNYLKTSLKILVISFIFNLGLNSNNRIVAQSEELKLGLVLSGGGAKGFAHIGALKVFEEEGIPISLIAGTSIGAIVGAMYSLGYTAQDIETFAKTQDWEVLLSDEVPREFKSPFKQDFEQKFLLQLSLNKEDRKLSLPSGLISGNNILNTLCGLTATISDSIKFSDLQIPFFCIAYDLTTGKEVVLNQGFLPKAMLSSMAFPGVISPVEFDGMKLVDGGIVNNFPVDVVKNMGADIIIGVDLQQANEEGYDFKSITGVFSGIIDKMGINKHERNVELADVVINPKIEGISTFSFYALPIDSIIKQGEIAAREKLPDIRRILKDKNIKSNKTKREVENEWLITKIIIPDKYKSERKYISTRLNLPTGKKYSVEQIKEAVTRIFAYGNFETVYYKLHPNIEGYSLELFINDNKESKMMLGAGLNTRDVTALYYNFSQQNNTDLISLLTLDAKIAVNPQAKFMMETHRLLFSVVGFEIEGRFNKSEYYNNVDKLGKLDIVNASATLYSYRRIRNVVDIGTGIRQHYFSSRVYGNCPESLFNADVDQIYTCLYTFLGIDNRDNSYLTNKGLFFNSTISLMIDNVKFSNSIPIYYFKLNAITALSKTVSISANLYHRSLYNLKSYPLTYASYASNQYNAFSDVQFPVLGQRGINFLKPISTLAEFGLRIKIGKTHYFTPKIQALSQFVLWKNMRFSNLLWCAGLTYQTKTLVGPVDMTFGFQDNLKAYSFYGGLGFQF